MGNNTVAMFLNDQADVLERRPEQVIATLRRCLSSGVGTDRFGGPGQMQVLRTEHADTLQIIAAGGNTIRTIGYAGWRDDDETILRKLADHLGFRVVRKQIAAHPAASETGEG